MSAHKPSYTNDDIKKRLLDAGASGTVYSLVMPESESGLSSTVDGIEDRVSVIEEAIKWQLYPQAGMAPNFQKIARDTDEALAKIRDAELLNMYREPWTSKQDAMHKDYFKTWLDWVKPIVEIDAGDFEYQYPTAGASEGIAKMLAEFKANHPNPSEATIHVFQGEYEGFRAFAEALNIRVETHPRGLWENLVPNSIGEHDQFWISQPSAIDGMVWPHFDEFVEKIHEAQPNAQVIPDLTYVGSVARDFKVNVNHPNIPAVVMSQSKPLGGYYHRVGGVLSKQPYGTLFGNVWFKNLQSLKWATDMMKRYDVHELPRKYRAYQEEACVRVGKLLGQEDIVPADVSVLGIAPLTLNTKQELKPLLRGSPFQEVIRVCLTPTMTTLIDPKMAPQTAPKLYDAWRKAGIIPKNASIHDPSQSAFRIRGRHMKP